MTPTRDVVLRGGPFDGTRYDAADSPLLELESEGMIHRYIATTKTQEADGEQLAVFQFDGLVTPESRQPAS